MSRRQKARSELESREIETSREWTGRAKSQRGGMKMLLCLFLSVSQTVKNRGEIPTQEVIDSKPKPNSNLKMAPNNDRSKNGTH